MPSQLLVVSKHEEDIAFAKWLAEENNLTHQVATTRDEVRWVLSSKTSSLVFWDAENESSYQAIGEVIPKYVKAHRIFAVTSKSLEYYPFLYRYPLFGHHLLRRYDDAAHEIYKRMIAAAIEDNQFGIASYFPPETPVKKITMRRYSHKRAAIEALQIHLTKQGVGGRLSNLIARSTDELILNALTKAPMMATRRNEPRYEPRDFSEDFELSQQDEIDVELAGTTKYMCVCVTDHYGSLKKLKFFDSIRRHYNQKTRVMQGAMAPATAVGLHGVLQAGLSLLLVSQPKFQTQAMLFFPLTDSYRDFRMGFKFLSMTEHLADTD